MNRHAHICTHYRVRYVIKMTSICIIYLQTSVRYAPVVQLYLALDLRCQLASRLGNGSLAYTHTPVAALFGSAVLCVGIPWYIAGSLNVVVAMAMTAVQ